MTVAAGATVELGVSFSPTSAGAASGQLTIASNDPSAAAIVVGLSGMGAISSTPSLGALTCASGTITGAGMDNCTVTLTSAAPSNGLSISLISNNPAVNVPTTVQVAAGASSAAFTAMVNAVSSRETVMLSASVNGTSQSFSLQLNAITPGLSISASNLSFGNVAVGTASAQSLTLSSTGMEAVTVSATTVAGSGFAVSGGNVPVTLAPGQTANLNVQFDPMAPGPASGQLTISSDSSNGGSIVVGLSGTGTITSVPVVSGVSCASSSVTGSTTDSCAVNLSAAAGSDGLLVGLTSSNSAVTVPSGVTIAPGATSAPFVATITAVTTAQSAILTASAGGASESVGLQLNPAAAALNASTTNVTFGNVNVNTTATRHVILTSSGNIPVTISSMSVTGNGFVVSGISVPQTLNPNQSVPLTVQFDPTSEGAVSGAITLVSNAATNGTLTLGLSGTGTISILPTLSAMSCASNSLTGSATDACTVTLSAAAPTGGQSVNLSSSNAAVSVPAAVVIPAGSTSGGFTATATSVSTAQTVTLTAATANTTQTFALQLGASVPTLSISTSSLSFGNVAVNSTSTQSLVLTSTGTTYVTVNGAAINGSGFTASGANFPLTLSPGQTATLTVQFNPPTTGAASGTLTLNSNSSTGPSTAVSLSGNGVPVLNGLTCANATMSGAGTDNCTVTLNAPAGNGGYIVSVASNNSSVAVPATVLIPSGATSAGFAATVTAVSSAATATLTANASSVTETFAIQLGGSSGQLNLSATSLDFGDVKLNTPATQTLSVTTNSILPIAVSLTTVTGPGFSLLGSGLPISITAGQPATIQVQFNPTTGGSSTGALTIVTTSLTNPTTVVALSGTGVTVSYEVNLAWEAPASSDDPVAGYDVLRSSDGGSSYQELNSSPTTQTAYTDTAVQNGQSYEYEVESVDASGVTSVPSNLATVAVPN